jgi:peptidoglycan/LPS O-acetylase OafA/YrhL
MFVLGQEWVWFFAVTEGGSIIWCPINNCTVGTSATGFLIDHPTFTVAIEATFYLLSPFLLRRSVRWALALCGLGLAWHILTLRLGLDRHFWNYFPVTSAAFFYFLGACTYHIYTWYRAEAPDSFVRKWSSRIESPGYVLIIFLMGATYLTAWDLRNIIIALMLAAVIPVLFDRTRANRLDRFVGELSYGVYLVHYPLLLLLWDLFGRTYGTILGLVLVVPIAILLYMSVEAPIDRWRQRRARAMGARLTREERPAVAPVKC